MMKSISYTKERKGLFEWYAALFAIFIVAQPFHHVFPLRVAGFSLTPSKMVVGLFVLVFGLQALRLSLRNIAFYRYSLMLYGSFFVLFFFHFVAAYRGVPAAGIKEVLSLVFLVVVIFFTQEVMRFGVDPLLKGLKYLGIIMGTAFVLALVKIIFQIQLGTAIEATRIDLPLLSQRTLGLPMSYGLNGILIFAVFPFAILSVFRKGFLYRRRSLAFLVSLLLIGYVILSNSRSTWVGMAAVLSFMVLMLAMQKRWLRLVVIGLLFVVLVLALAHLEKITDYKNWGMYRIRSKAVDTRLAQLRIAFRLIQENPLVGLGHGVFIKMNEDVFLLETPYLHNYFLSIMVDTGLVNGFVVLLLFLAAAWNMVRSGWKASSFHQRWICLALFCGFSGMITELMFYTGASGIEIVYVYISAGFALKTGIERHNGLGGSSWA